MDHEKNRSRWFHKVPDHMNASIPTTRKSRRLARTAATAGSVLLFIACLLYLVRSHRMSEIPLEAILLSQPLALLIVILVGIRLGLLLPKTMRSYRTGIIATFIGGGFGIILPMRAGEALKLLVLRRRTHAPLSTLVGVILLERVGDVFVLMVLGSVALLGRTGIEQLLLATAVVGMFLLMKPLGGFTSRFLKRRRRSWLRNLAGWIDNVVELSTVRSLTWSVITSLPAQVTCILTAYIVIHAVSPEHTSILAATAICFGTAVGLGIGVAPAGVGTFEAAGAGALMVLGWPTAEALEAALSLHIAYFILVTPIGGLLTGSELPRFFRGKFRPENP